MYNQPVPGVVQGAALRVPQPCPGVLNCPAAGLDCGCCGLYQRERIEIRHLKSEELH